MTKKLALLGAALCAVLLAATAAFAAVTGGNTGWRWGNPLPQGNTLLTLDAVGNRVYAGGANGTLVRSDDAGVTWSTVRTGLLDDVRKVRAIGVDSFVFAGACALRRSDDGGATVRRLAWRASDENCSEQIKSFSFVSGSVGFLLLDNGVVYATTDGGSSWNKQTTVPGTSAAGGSAAPGDIWFTSGSSGVASAGNHLYQTTDGANSWTPVGPALGVGQTMAGFDFSNPNDGYVVGAGGTVLKTADGGATWAAPDAGSPSPATSAGGGDGQDLNTIDCPNATTCLATNAKGNKLLRSIDSGFTWSAVSPASNGVFAVGFTSGTRAVAVGAGGTTVASDDKGANWAQISSGVSGTFTGVRAESASTAFAYGRAGLLARTTDGGATWAPVGVSTSNDVLDVAFPSAARGYVLDNSGVVLRSLNGGGSWQFLDTGQSSAPNAMTATSDSNVLLAGPKGVRRSSDGGDSFGPAKGKGLKRASLDYFDRAGKSLFVYGGKSIFVAGLDGKIWRPVKRPSAAKSIWDLDMVSAKAGYLLDSRDELYVTRNGGKKWTRIETTGAGETADIAFGDMRHGYMTDYSGRILYTGDGGATWSRQYPFYDIDENSPQLIDAPTGNSAFSVVGGTNRIFSTSTNGLNGTPSTLTIKTAKKKVKRGTTIKVTGKLSPASGGERVTVLARAIGAKAGASWTLQERTVAANGSFTTSWRVKKPTIFIARWSGDSGHDGDGAPALKVTIK